MAQHTKGQNDSSPLTTKNSKNSKRADKLSLHPMEFEDALAALLNTPPPLKPAKTTKKQATKKKR